MLPSFKNLNSDAEIKSAIVEVANAAGGAVDNTTLRHQFCVQSSVMDRLVHELANSESAPIALELKSNGNYSLTATA
jgi:hypothetical protein